MYTSKEILALITINEATMRNFGIKKIGLFGSYVNNEQTNLSDIDILVEFADGKKNFDNYMDLKFFLEDAFNCKVDLVITECVKPELAPNIFRSVQYAEYRSLS